MGAISKLSKKCKKCPYVKNCNNKRMEACAFMKLPKKLLNDCSAPLTSSLMEQATKPHTSVTIKMGDYGTVNTSMEEISEKIKKAILQEYV